MGPGASVLLTDPILSGVPVREGYKVLGGVVLYRRLGQGGMGAVYGGRHLRLDIEVAVKVMALPPQASHERVRNFARRFVREARTAAAVKHPNLIRVYDVNSEGGVRFLIMEYVDGESAGDRLERKKRLPEAEAVRIALGAAEGLAAAHERGIVHRDVKPDNILIDGSGNVVLVDLGLAKACGSAGSGGAPRVDLSSSWEAVGTPSYMSPEQTRASREIGPATDVWSLGVTLYELVTGRLPFRDTDVNDLIYRIRRDPLPDMKLLHPDLTDGLCDMVERALAKRPDERHADCAEFAAELREHLARALPDAPPLAGPRNDSAEPPAHVEPPPRGTLERIAASLSTGSPGAGAADAREGRRNRDTGETEPLAALQSSRTATDLVERRVRAEDAREELGEPQLDGESGLFRLVDRDIRIARELEERDAPGALERYTRVEEALATLRKRRRALEGVDWRLLSKFYPELHEEARARIKRSDESFRDEAREFDGTGYVRIASSLAEAELLAETRRQERRFSAVMAVVVGTAGALLGGMTPVASRFASAARWASAVGACVGLAGGVGLVVLSLVTATGSETRGALRRRVGRALTFLAGGPLGAVLGLATAAIAAWMYSLLRVENATVAVVRAGVIVGAAVGAAAGALGPNRARRSVLSKAVVGLVFGGLAMALLASWVPVVTRQSGAAPGESGSVAGAVSGLLCGIVFGVVAGTMNGASEKGAVARLALSRRAAAEGRSEGRT